MKEPIYILPHNIEVIGEYQPSGENKYWRVRIREHSLFDAKVVSSGMYIRRSRVVMTSILGRALLETEHVHHKDENVNNDSPSNLELLSADEHNKHHKIGCKHTEESKSKIGTSLKAAYESGRREKPNLHGDRNPCARLTKAQVLEIRASDLTSRKLGTMYGVSKTTILNIKSNKTWSK